MIPEVSDDTDGPVGVQETPRMIQHSLKILLCCRLTVSLIFYPGEKVAHHMSVAVEMGVWFTISGATYSGVPYLQ